jgi:hypothetical protein
MAHSAGLSNPEENRIQREIAILRVLHGSPIAIRFVVV